MTTIQELEGLIYTEYINLSNALKIIQNYDNIIKDLPEHRQQKINDSTFDPLIHLKKMCKDKKSIIHTTYKFSKNLKTYGRLFANSSSLQNLPREIRNALAEGLYYDIDISNCHPNLLSQYCKIKGIYCEYLNKYVNDRNTILETISKETHIPRDQLKQSFLTILNGGNPDIPLNSHTDFINDFKDEINKIHKNLICLNKEEYKKVKLRKEHNINGSVMNVILCKLEHNILMNSVLFLRKLGFNIDVLVFDGFMVRKEPNKDLNDNVLKDLSEHIKKITGYDLQFIEKTFNNEIDLSKYVEPIMEKISDVSYYKDKEEFEKTHLKIIHPPIFITVGKDGNLEYQTEEKLKQSYKHLKSTYMVNEKVESIRFIDKWIDDEHIRVYDKMVFEPPPVKVDMECYNTWRNFKIEEVELPSNFNIETNEYILMYKDFIKNLFDGNEEFINYYDAWCANIIQYPAYRSSICLVLYSLFEGVGKNMSTRTLELCIGENYTFYVSDATNQLFGKHSSVELNRLLIVLNEVKGKDTYSNSDLFKTRITDTKREIEMKGKDTIQIKNYCSYILNTNNLKSVNAGDKDRRFCVIPCVNKKINDKKYFDNYERTINCNPEAIRCIYEYLKTFDIEKIVPNRIFADDKVRPKSEIYKDLQECNREKEWDFIEDLVNMVPVDEDEDIVIKRSFDNFWSLYKKFCEKNNYDINKYTSKSFHYIFTHTIIDFLNNIDEYKDVIKKGRNATERYYTIDISKLKKYFMNIS